LSTMILSVSVAAETLVIVGLSVRPGLLPLDA
jgi:hypothetical protein